MHASRKRSVMAVLGIKIRRAFHEGIEQVRRVSTTLRQVLTEFSEFFHVSGTGLLIQTSLGRAGGLGALRTKRSG